MPNGYQVFRDQFVPVLPRDVPENWSFKHRKRDRNMPAMTPERARELLRGNSALVRG